MIYTHPKVSVYITVGCCCYNSTNVACRDGVISRSPALHANTSLDTNDGWLLQRYVSDFSFLEELWEKNEIKLKNFVF